MIDYNPLEDGVTHVNVYSKSRCLLGRLLSNFAHTPIEQEGLKFESIESWWYYTKMKNINAGGLFPIFTEEQLNEVSKSVGNSAKQKFRELYKEDSTSYNPTREEVLEIYILKAESHEDLNRLLLENKLPFSHYYMMFDKKVNADDYLWTAELWNEVKEKIIKKQNTQ
jgi:predicted NAD-dependent protein-ADP-ribosyltransferase YbiA (DUF1768 family)